MGPTWSAQRALPKPVPSMSKHLASLLVDCRSIEAGRRSAVRIRAKPGHVRLVKGYLGSSSTYGDETSPKPSDWCSEGSCVAERHPGVVPCGRTADLRFLGGDRWSRIA